MRVQPLLHQRLDLYRFAYVMVDPIQLPCQRDWLLPRLTASVANDEALAARLHLPTPMAGERGPILSSCIRRLHYWRNKDCLRPLILLRPAFEHTVAPHRLAGLARVPPILGRMMFEHDAYTPLEWRRPMGAVAKTPEIQFSHKGEQHPLLMRYRALCKSYPYSTFTIQEDGRIAEQTSLASLLSQRSICQPDHDAFEAYDQQWLKNYGHHQGHCYVMSRSKAALSWFARDSLRLLGPYAYRWFYPQEPDLRNSGLNWILVQDHALRWTYLQRNIPVVQLDCDPSTTAFRQLRLMQGGRVRWRSSNMLVAKGLLQLGKQSILCQDVGRGWQLALSEQAAEDRSLMLNRKLEAMTMLSA